MPTRLRLNNVRLAFPQLWEAKKVQGEGEASYSAIFLIDPKDPQVAAIQKAIHECATERWGQKAKDTIASMAASDRMCLHKGDSKSEYDGFAGMLFVSARTKVRPLVLAADKSVLTKEDGKPYAGCYVHASLDIWAQDNSFGKRINAGLRGVQFCRDGDAFGGGVPAQLDEFDDVSDGAGA